MKEELKKFIESILKNKTIDAKSLAGKCISNRTAKSLIEKKKELASTLFFPKKKVEK